MGSLFACAFVHLIEVYKYGSSDALTDDELWVRLGREWMVEGGSIVDIQDPK